MESIWDTTCKCGADARVELVGNKGNTVLRVGCDEHWVELPTECLQEELTRLGSKAPESPNS